MMNLKHPRSGPDGPRALARAASLGLLAMATTAAAQSDVRVEGPAVSTAVAPRTQTRDLSSLAATRGVDQWLAGQPVRVVEDLREQERADGPNEPSAAREAVSPDVMERDLRALRAAEPFRGGDPVRVMPDLREDGTGGTSRDAGAGTRDGAGALAPGAGSLASTTVLADFDGIPATGSLPPDTVGAVGPKHYVQMVNTAFAIFDKQGNQLVAPININSLWAGFGGPCETQNNGDPVVRYDHLADRWVISQFAIPGPDMHECFAISRTADPVAGGWFLYDFPTTDSGSGNPVFPDYPKVGVWPDAYYMGTQRGFPGGGLDVWAFERARMLAGQPAQRVQFAVAQPSLFLMPSDLDGPPPPAGTPAFFARQVDGDQFGGADRVEVFAFHVDWANPAASTFTPLANLPTAAFDSKLCAGGLIGTCVPQPGTTQRLETLTVWPMWRLQYRNFGTHEVLLTNHTVDADGRDLAGVRWYELRRPPAGAWSIHQQGTHAPDDVHRWMGSVAMDGSGNIALGYSVSSATVHPGIRYAYRAPTDPAGALPNEQNLVTGAGSQTHPSSRWGNYSTLDVDPRDPCTFWYTTEYYASTSAAGWRTRISSFRLEPCSGPSNPPQSTGWQYAAKFVCGISQKPDDMRLAPGFYASVVNVHNPGPDRVTFLKTLALAYPPEEQKPGEVMPIAKDVLEPGQALKVDCMDVRRRLFPNGFPTPYIDGFIVLKASGELDVSAVYTTASIDRSGKPVNHSSIDVEAVKGRRLGGDPGGGKCPDLVVRTVGQPSVSCPGGGGTCVTKVDVTVGNDGAANAGASNLRTVLDPAASVIVNSPVGGLGPGASVIVPVTSPPGGNCFDPDCSIKATIDSANVVPECNENNNVGTNITIG